jgi:hypothetical protein
MPKKTYSELNQAVVPATLANEAETRPFLEKKPFHALAEEKRFRRLASTWKSETRFLSNVTTKAMHAAYQKIIGMGKDAIPYILEDLAENGPNDWFWALTAITEENPITERMSGNMAAMTEAWLRWGENAGYLRDCHERTSSVSQI